MASKISAEVLIGGKVYTLSGYESEEYLQRVALFLNRKLDELKDTFEGFNHMSQDSKSLLLELNLADEYFKAKDTADRMEADMEEIKTSESNMKHDLISMQIKLDTLQETIAELEQKNKELLLNKEQLENSLENKLFDTKQ